MRLFIAAALLFLTTSFRVVAQPSGTVSGHVKSANTMVLPEGTTVSLVKASDSGTLVSLLIKADGSYRFDNIGFGSYRITATATGFHPVVSPAFTLSADKQSMHLPTLRMQVTQKLLSSITVSTKKPMIEQKIDRTIVNVDASVTNIGLSALEVLEKAPGVIVDRDGNISLKGKEGVMVMVDGRPTQLGGADLANLLRNMNASQLDQVEIMTNPPAKYDAAGNAGIINIKTKKSNIKGFNGAVSLTYAQGRYPKLNEGLNFNYRTGKMNLFLNINHGYRKNFELMTIQRNIRNESTNELENYFEQEANKINVGHAFSNKIGLDYFATGKTTFGIVLNQFNSNTEVKNRNQTNIANAAKDLQSITKALVNNDSRWKNYGVNLNYRSVLDTTGRELSAEADFLTYDANNQQFMINQYYNPTGNWMGKADSLRGNLPQQMNVYSARLDYVHPLKKGARLEAGVKGSSISTDNNAVYDSIQYGEIIRDVRRSNHFIYEENITAAYLTLNGSLSKKLSIQLGLRLENTQTKGSQLTTGINFKRQYTQLFPTTYLQYKLDEKNNIGVNYGRRIRRPNYESLNPFIRFIDRYTYSVGNPDLKPQISHSIELTHSFKNKVTTTFNYTSTTDIIQNIIEQKGQEAYAKPGNIASLRQYGIAVTINNNITKWWTNNLNLNLFRNNFNGIVNNTHINLSATRLFLNGTQQFKLGKTLTGEISGGYRSAGLEGVMRLDAMGLVSVGFSQQLLQNKASIRLSVRDIFYIQRARATINYGNVDAVFQEVRDTRVVSVGISYRFSKGKINNTKKKAAGSAAEEQDRIGMD
jgi:iron complex outermembrane recepter protein